MIRLWRFIVKYLQVIAWLIYLFSATAHSNNLMPMPLVTSIASYHPELKPISRFSKEFPLNLSLNGQGYPSRTTLTATIYPHKIKETNLTRYTSTLVISIPTPNLLNIFNQEVNSRIPQTTCRHRYYHHNDTNISSQDEGIHIRANYTYEKWTCEKIPYPCHDSWLDFDTCYKDFKTRIYKSTFHPYLNILSRIDTSEGLKILFETNAGVESRAAHPAPHISVPSIQIFNSNPIPFAIARQKVEFTPNYGPPGSFTINILMETQKLKHSAILEIEKILLKQGFNKE